jgi:hypothetical protein
LLDRNVFYEGPLGKGKNFFYCLLTNTPEIPIYRQEERKMASYNIGIQNNTDRTPKLRALSLDFGLWKLPLRTKLFVFVAIGVIAWQLSKYMGGNPQMGMQSQFGHSGHVAKFIGNVLTVVVFYLIGAFIKPSEEPVGFVPISFFYIKLTYKRYKYIFWIMAVMLFISEVLGQLYLLKS